MARESFSSDKNISVKFTDDVGYLEGAVDLIGPMKEFFSLATEKVSSENFSVEKSWKGFYLLSSRL